jgi:hypothetical protein
MQADIRKENTVKHLLLKVYLKAVNITIHYK